MNQLHADRHVPARLGHRPKACRAQEQSHRAHPLASERDQMTRRIRRGYRPLRSALAKQSLHRTEIVPQQRLRFRKAPFEGKFSGGKRGTLRKAPERGVCGLRHVPGFWRES